MFKSSEILNNAQMRQQRVRGGFESLRRLRQMLLDYLIMRFNELLALRERIIREFPPTALNYEAHLGNLEWFGYYLLRAINRITVNAHPVGIYAPSDFDANFDPNIG